MNFYNVQHATEKKIIGSVYPQAKAIYTTHIDDPNYIHNISPTLSKIEKEPIIPMAQLKNQSVKMTDLLSITGYGFSFRLLISDKLKKILESEKHLGFQFFKTLVLDTKNVQHPYWIVNPHVFFPEYIDFENSELWSVGSGGKKLERVYCNSIDEFERQKKNSAPVPILLYSIALKENEIEYDWFSISEVNGVIAHFISENLKNKIESAGCRGMNFIKVER